MTKLNVSSSGLCAEGGKCLAEALNGNQVMAELNISQNRLAQDDNEEPDMSGIIALAGAIPDMGALLVLSLNSNSLGPDGGKALAEGLRGNRVIKELNIANNNLANFGYGMSGIFALADILPGMRALSVANVMGNKIGKEQLTKLQEIMRSNPNLASLCGIADDAAEADLSGLGMDADDAVILASELPDKGGLLVLSLQSNNLRAESGMALAEGLKGNHAITDLNIASNYLGYDFHGKPDMSGVVALADAIPDMGGVTSLDISNNDIVAKGAAYIAKAISQVYCFDGKPFLETCLLWRSKCKHCGDPMAGHGKYKGALTKLDISSNRIAAAQGKDLQRICAASGIELAK
jgi:hypothetical protein